LGKRRTFYFLFSLHKHGPGQKRELGDKGGRCKGLTQAPPPRKEGGGGGGEEVESRQSGVLNGQVLGGPEERDQKRGAGLKRILPAEKSLTL